MKATLMIFQNRFMCALMSHGRCLLAATLLLPLFAGCVSKPAPLAVVPKWDRFECVLESAAAYENPPQQALLTAAFVSPLGETFRVYGFWDGGKTWRVRFMPNQAGRWTYTTTCSDAANAGLQGQTGAFLCTAPLRRSLFSTHGPVRVSHNGRSLEHEDLTPFFWMGDTAWNGPLLSTDEEWSYYLQERSKQKFSAVQWVTTQWRADPTGDAKGRLAYTNKNPIVINPEFFQRLDQKVDAMNRAGLLSVPVMLWAINGGSNPQINPGVSLPEDQQIVLARYMLARWGANHVVWILNGDGDYRGANAARWKNIGRAVFNGISHAPVTLHPGGRQWVWDEFRNEPWLNICGYQSGHDEGNDNLRWIFSGPASKEWLKEPTKPFISLEAPYENHVGGNKTPMTADTVRRAHYWSLLNAPTVGVTYGGHGIWGWDDGTKPPVDHPSTGTPLPWFKALTMPGAQQMTHLVTFFKSINYQALLPAPQLVAVQPGQTEPRRYIAAARSEAKDMVVVYIPEDRMVELRMEALTDMPKSPVISWFNPRTGEKRSAVAVLGTTTCQIPTPEAGDWVLLIKAGE